MALICVSLSAAFDVALVGAPLAAATVSSKLRRSLAPRSLPLNSNLLCLRGGQTQQSFGSRLMPLRAAWGQKLSKHNVGLNSRSGRLFLSLRSAESLHGGGGYKVEEEEVAPNSETGAPLAKHRPKRIFTEAEQEERQIRREEYAQQRASRLEKIASGETGLGKVRQHVNPLAPAFRDPIPTPDWKQVYARQDLPLHIDMGCGKGRMLLEMAKQQPDRNFLGVEIREPLVVRADRWVREEGIKNLHYVSGNINVSIESLLAAYAGPLDLVSVLMPDPWFKNRHKKRRLLQPVLVQQIADRMQPGARFFVMSDVKEAAEEMVQILDASIAFSSWDGKWAENPLPIGTEREISCMSRGEPIYRAIFTRV